MIYGLSEYNLIVTQGEALFCNLVLRWKYCLNFSYYRKRFPPLGYMAYGLIKKARDITHNSNFYELNDL